MHRMKSIISLIAALATVSLLAAACGSEDPTPTPRPTPTSAPVATATPVPTPTPLPPGATPPPTATPRPPTPTPDASFEAKWAELVAAAQEEGEIVIILSGTLSRTGRPTFDYFGEKFGIKMVTSSGSGPNNANRLLAERARGKFTVDVSTVSGGSMERIRAAGGLSPLEPLIIDPSILEDRSNWYYKDPVYLDSEGQYALANSISVGNIGGIWYNTENVTQEELDSIQHYTDLLDPQWKGRMVMRAMNNPGSKSVFARLWLSPELGPDYLDALHTQFEQGDLVDSEADKEIADGLAQGKWDIALFGGGRDLDALRNLGLPVDELTEQKLINPGASTELGGSHVLIDQAPHPNAAALWLNWWLSQEGQSVHRDNLQQFGAQDSGSLRSDVPQYTTTDSSWETIQLIPEWIEQGILDDKLIVFEQNEEWHSVRENMRDHFNALYSELGFDAWVTYQY